VVLGVYDRMETWSQLALDAILATAAGSPSHPADHETTE
jgi:hypothetical protein